MCNLICTFVDLQLLIKHDHYFVHQKCHPVSYREYRQELVSLW